MLLILKKKVVQTAKKPVKPTIVILKQPEKLLKHPPAHSCFILVLPMA